MVEKNERADDSRVKSWLQNFLGGLVLLALPSIASVGFNTWNTLGIAVNEQRHIVESVAAIERRVDRLEDWRGKTEQDRFRWSDGDALRQAIAGVSTELYKLKESVNDHNSKAEKYIEKIGRIEQDSHRHSYKPVTGK